MSQGSADVPLNANGIAQAHAAARLLPGRGIAAIVSSPLSRARVTAEIAADALGLPVSFDAELREAAFGVMEGRPMSEWFHDWVAERSTPEGAESFPALRLRAVAAVDRALASPPLVLVVAHGALFRSLRSAMGLSPGVRLMNAIPMLCEPPAEPGGAWALTAA